MLRKPLLTAIFVLLAGILVARLVRRTPPETNGPTLSAMPVATLDGYPFDARYSGSAREQAMRLADLVKDGYAYFATIFPETSPKFTAAFFSPDDWTRGYGMPSYDPVEKRLRVATDDNSL
jgi:hypothetical protein